MIDDKNDDDKNDDDNQYISSIYILTYTVSTVHTHAHTHTQVMENSTDDNDKIMYLQKKYEKKSINNHDGVDEAEQTGDDMMW